MITRPTPAAIFPHGIPPVTGRLPVVSTAGLAVCCTGAAFGAAGAVVAGGAVVGAAVVGVDALDGGEATVVVVSGTVVVAGTVVGGTAVVGGVVVATVVVTATVVVVPHTRFPIVSQSQHGSSSWQGTVVGGVVVAGTVVGGGVVVVVSQPPGLFTIPAMGGSALFSHHQLVTMCTWGGAGTVLLLCGGIVVWIAPTT